MSILMMLSREWNISILFYKLFSLSHTHTHTRAQIYMHIYAYICIYKYIYTCINSYIHTYANTHTHTHTHTHIYIYIYIYIYSSLVSWGCRIQQFHLCRGIRPLPWVSCTWHYIIWWWSSSNAVFLSWFLKCSFRFRSLSSGLAAFSFELNELLLLFTLFTVGHTIAVVGF